MNTKTKKLNSRIIKNFGSKGVFPYQFAFTLLIPLRNIFLSPKKLISRLELKEDSIVLEIGPGPGYFSLKLPSIYQGVNSYLLIYNKKC